MIEDLKNNLMTEISPLLGQRGIKKFGLDRMSGKDYEYVKKISDFAGNELFKTGMALSFAKAEEQAKVAHLSALAEQNWIIIR